MNDLTHSFIIYLYVVSNVLFKGIVKLKCATGNLNIELSKTVIVYMIGLEIKVDR